MQGKATITLELDDYDLLRKKIKERDEQIASLQGALRFDDAAVLAKLSNDLPVCLNAFIGVLTFAVGNVTPYQVRGWPYEELRVLETLCRTSELLKAHRDLAPIIAGFLKEAEEIERKRLAQDRVVS